jgi:hypothetical protein
MSWTEILKLLKHADVRNMYWLLASPSPLAYDSYPEISVFPTHWQESLCLSAHHFFKDLDQDPRPLEAHLKKLKSSRLGVYAEALLGYFFENFEGVQLLLTNYQVIKAGETLGEVDFIIEWDERVIHIELAVKYYLANGATNEFSEWIGPSGNDNLGKKLEKVKKKQLPLTKSEEFRIKTNLYPESYLFMKGCFFSRDNFLPKWKNELAIFGDFCFLKDILNDKYDLSYLKLLSRPNWMASLTLPIGESRKGLNKLEIQELVKIYGSLLFFNEKLNTPMFVVQDEWSTKF